MGLHSYGLCVWRYTCTVLTHAMRFGSNIWDCIHMVCVPGGTHAPYLHMQEVWK